MGSTTEDDDSNNKKSKRIRVWAGDWRLNCQFPVERITIHLTKAAKYTNLHVNSLNYSMFIIQISCSLNNVLLIFKHSITVIIGGMAAVKQERILNKGSEIVIATPARLWELIERNSHLSQIDSIR